MNNCNDFKFLSELFKDFYGLYPSKVIKLPGAGSARRYYLMKDESNRNECIGVAGENQQDANAFVNLTDLFLRHGLCVPKVLSTSPDNKYYLEENLGDISLYSLLKSNQEEIKGYMEESISGLVKMQNIPHDEWLDIVEYKPFDLRMVMWDLNYFKYEYLKVLSIDFNEDKLEDEFERLARNLIEEGNHTEGFMYRDFQSRNIMIKDGTPYFIDYQGGRRGPGVYDVVSLMWQASAGFSSDFRERMVNLYAMLKSGGDEKKYEEITRSVPYFVLFRTLQVLGAYGLRGLVEKKAHFITSIPGALKNLGELLEMKVLKEYPELEKCAVRIINDSRFQTTEKDAGLTINIFSFSYKKGYPADYTGNGGGFMFDCRGMHNPGRYAEYKDLTGIDREVSDFLISRGEALPFVESAVNLISPTIERYCERGFTDLQIGFGCTGGQHRSVFCAENTARRLKEKYPDLRVIVNHREQGLYKEL